MNLSMNSLIELDDKILLRYLKWMEYIPKHWNLNNILDKNISELTDSEIRIMNVVKIEKKYIELIKQYLNDKKDDNKNKILNYLNKISIEDYAKLKLNQEELEFCNSAIKIYILSDLNVGINKIQNIENRNMKEEYILYKLLIEKATLNINKKKIKK